MTTIFRGYIEQDFCKTKVLFELYCLSLMRSEKLFSEACSPWIIGFFIDSTTKIKLKLILKPVCESISEQWAKQQLWSIHTIFEEVYQYTHPSADT